MVPRSVSASYLSILASCWRILQLPAFHPVAALASIAQMFGLVELDSMHYVFSRPIRSADWSNLPFRHPCLGSLAWDPKCSPAFMPISLASSLALFASPSVVLVVLTFLVEAAAAHRKFGLPRVALGQPYRGALLETVDF